VTNGVYLGDRVETTCDKKTLSCLSITTLSVACIMQLQLQMPADADALPRQQKSTTNAAERHLRPLQHQPPRYQRCCLFYLSATTTLGLQFQPRYLQNAAKLMSALHVERCRMGDRQTDRPRGLAHGNPRLEKTQKLNYNPGFCRYSSQDAIVLFWYILGATWQAWL
jgi:hypothetical protein